VFNAYIDEDGDDPNGVAIQFGYSNVSTVLFSNYLWFTSWSTANYTEGEAADSAVSPLLPSTIYYYNTQAQNAYGYSYGIEQTFITPGASTTVYPSNFILLPSTTSVDMEWTKPSGYSATRLYYKVGSIPSSNTTGTLLYSGTNNYYTHTGLLSGTTYGYRVYGYEGGAWSLPGTGIVTTKGTSTGTGMINPSAILDWFQETDYTKQSATFLFPIINNMADSFSMPRNTAWLTWALAVSMFFGFLVWSASRSMMMTGIAVCGGILVGVAQGLLPKYMVMFVLIFAITIISIRERI
jgi:hypothetical protein